MCDFANFYYKILTVLFEYISQKGLAHLPHIKTFTECVYKYEKTREDIISFRGTTISGSVSKSCSKPVPL